MKSFKKIVGIVNRTVASFGLGFGMGNLFRSNYEVAAWTLLVVSFLFAVGYFAERWSK